MQNLLRTEYRSAYLYSYFDCENRRKKVVKISQNLLQKHKQATVNDAKVINVITSLLFLSYQKLKKYLHSGPKPDCF